MPAEAPRQKRPGRSAPAECVELRSTGGATGIIATLAGKGFELRTLQMKPQLVKHELQNVISGKSGASYDPIIQTALGYLRASTSSGPMAQGKLEIKEQEAAQLIRFAEGYELRLREIPEERFISSGAEQRVYIAGEDYVLKLNDAIYYASWRDYLHNLLLHNYFFNDTAYDLNGFTCRRM